MAELVLLCIVCPVCKVVGGGFGGNDFGDHHCADWHLHPEYFPEIVEAANLAVQPHSGSPESPLASSPCPLSPGVSNGNHLLSLLTGDPLSPVGSHVAPPLLCLVTWVPAEILPSLCLWMPLPTVPSTEAGHLGSTQEGVGEWGSYNAWITVLTQVLGFSHPHPTAGFSVNFSFSFLFFFSFSTSASSSSLSSF